MNQHEIFLIALAYVAGVVSPLILLILYLVATENTHPREGEDPSREGLPQ